MARTTSPAETDVAVAARLFRSLGDTTRLALLLTLTEGEQRVTDLVAAVGSSQSNVSGHLACLKECGLVVDRPAQRRQVFYRIADPAIYDLLRAAERMVVANGVAIELCRNPLMEAQPVSGEADRG
jgi:DNA-binding transcriptional ArsR family regulator